MRPIIGLTTYGRHELQVQPKHFDQFFAIPALYVDAVRRAGGVPILLPPGETDWQEILTAVDGIIVIGGSDIHPDRYDGNPHHPALTGFDEERDESELALTRLLIDQASRPTLCICRGMQVLNVALGGTMTEHIPDIRPADIHRSADGGWTLQSVAVTPGSLLHTVMGSDHVTTYSGHHQAVKAIAARLHASATAADGLVEALEAADHPWLLAVQWHPEMSAADDPTQQRLFDELVHAAAQSRGAFADNR